MNIPAFMKVDATTCTIKRLTHDVDHEMGVSPGTYDTISSNVVCTMDEVTSWMRIHGGREMVVQGAVQQKAFKLCVLSTEDIEEGDQVVVGGKTYRVDNVTPYSTHKEAMITK